MQSPTDEALLHRVAAGDEGAFATLYDRLGRVAYSFAYRMLGYGDGAEDVVQEAFLSIWRAAGSFDVEKGNARTWLMSVVHHRAVDTLRRRRGQQPMDLSIESIQQLAGPENVWDQVARNIDKEAIERVLAQIPQEQRHVIDLAYFGGYTHTEIAERVGVPLGTVKGRIRIGVEKLKRLLQERDAGV